MTATEENVPSSRTDELQRVLFAIAVTLGLNVHEDCPEGAPGEILENVERALNGIRLSSYLRGVRAGRSCAGLDPDWVEGL